MAKTAKDFMNAKNAEIKRLEDLQQQLKQSKADQKNKLAELEAEELRIKESLRNFEDEHPDNLSADLFVADWVKTRDAHVKKFIQPALDKALAAKTQYRSALQEFINAVETLSREQNELTYLMERESMHPADINRIKTTERYRPNYQDFGRIFISPDEFEELDRKINFIFGR